MNLLDLLEKECYIHLKMSLDCIEYWILFDYSQKYFSSRLKKIKETDEYLVVEISYYDIFMLNVVAKLVTIWTNKAVIDLIVTNLVFDQAVSDELQNKYIKLRDESPDKEAMQEVISKVLKWRDNKDYYRITKQDELNTWINLDRLREVVDEISSFSQRQDIIRKAYETVHKDEKSAFIIAFYLDPHTQWLEIRFNTLESIDVGEKWIDIVDNKNYLWVHFFQLNQLVPQVVIESIKGVNTLDELKDWDTLNLDIMNSKKLNSQSVYNSAIGYINSMRILSSNDSEVLKTVNINMKYKTKNAWNKIYTWDFSVAESDIIYKFHDLQFDFIEMKFYVRFWTDKEVCMNIMRWSNWYYPYITWRDKKTLSSIWYIYIIAKSIESWFKAVNYKQNITSQFIDEFNEHLWDSIALNNKTETQLDKLLVAVRNIIKETQSEGMKMIFNYLEIARKNWNT